jgi:large subunit ribosomal protein L17
MRRGKHRKFGREAGQRRVLYRALATALIEHGKIKTTQAKAKSLSGHVDKLITTAKKGDLTARRLLLAQVGEKAVKKLITDVAPSMSGRNGGYTRTIKLGQRRSDGAPMALIEFVK